MTAHTISETVEAWRRRCAAALLVTVVLWASAAGAQSTLFTYQGQLIEAGTPANGEFDLQFALFGADQGEAPIGTTQTLSNVTVSNGLFTVDLDFGVTAFPGDNRFLEISVRPAGGGSFTTLTPRQFISASPYSIRSLNAASADALSSTCTGCVGDTQIQSVAGSKVTGTIPVASVPAGSDHYTQNTTTPQLNANFNISGNGTAGGTLSAHIVNATDQYNVAGMHALSVDDKDNTFVGRHAGAVNDAEKNSFFGAHAGAANSSGSDNNFFGDAAGQANTTGFSNAFFGSSSGGKNTTGTFNAFFGPVSGAQTTTGSHNAFFGSYSGVQNTTGSNNTAIGDGAGVTTGNLTNATAIGWAARVSQSNSLVLGSINGVNSATADTNVGIGTTAPAKLLHVHGLGSNGLGFGDLVVTGTGTVGAAITLNSTEPDNSTGPGGRTYSWISTAHSADSGGGKLAAFDVTHSAYRMVIDSVGNVGIGTTSPDRTLTVNGTADKPGGGSWGTFSDERLKNIKGQFTSGLNAVMRLRPLRYEYKRDNALEIKSDGEHVGFSAQDVQRIIPEAVSTNDKGYLLVNNDPILWTMLNAIQEQQQQIEQLRGELRQLRAASMGSQVERPTALAAAH